MAGGTGEQGVTAAVGVRNASVNSLCLLGVLGRKRWVPVLGPRPLENISFRSSPKHVKEDHWEGNGEFASGLDKALKQAQPVTGASAVAVGPYE